MGVTASRLAKAALGLFLSGALSACVGRAATSHSLETVPLRIQGTPLEATVTIDDQRVGPLSLVAARGIRVLPGRHRVTVEAAGYLPFDAAFEAKDEVVPLVVNLVPVPD
jgi:hypothetical protein